MLYLLPLSSFFTSKFIILFANEKISMDPSHCCSLSTIVTATSTETKCSRRRFAEHIRVSRQNLLSRKDFALSQKDAVLLAASRKSNRRSISFLSRPLSYPRLVKPNTVVNERNGFRRRSKQSFLGETSFEKLPLRSVSEFNSCRERNWMPVIYFA